MGKSMPKNMQVRWAEKFCLYKCSDANYKSQKEDVFKWQSLTKEKSKGRTQLSAP